MGQIQQSGPAQEETAARANAVAQAQAAQQMPLPKTGPQIEQGASVAHNLGQAVLMALKATRPGQAINQAIYEPGEKAYAMKQAGLAGTEKAYGEQAKGAQEETQTLGQVAGRAVYGAARTQAAETTATGGATRAQIAANAVMGRAGVQLKADLAKIAGMKDIAAQRNEAMLKGRQMYDETLKEITQGRDATAEDVEAARSASAQTVKSMDIANKPSVLGAIYEGIFGGEVAQPPSAPAATRGPVQPTSAAKGAGNTPHKPTPSGMKVGQEVKLKNGKTVKVTAVHPDGSFDAN
jgi:hypothetical protein